MQRILWTQLPTAKRLIKIHCTRRWGTHGTHLLQRITESTRGKACESRRYRLNGIGGWAPHACPVGWGGAPSPRGIPGRLHVMTRLSKQLGEKRPRAIVIEIELHDLR